MTTETYDGNVYNVITGTENGETLTGSTGREQDDILSGLGGDDTIDAKNGDDIVIGGAGDDELSGGAGDDIFVFNFDVDTEPGEGEDIVTTFDLTPPGANADWKAWENYENRLKTFFLGDGSTENSYASLKAAGYVFGFDDTAFELMKQAFNDALSGQYNASGGGDDHSYQLISNPNAPAVSGKNKIANTNGNDVTNHQIDNNLGLANDLATDGGVAGATGKAAFITFANLGATHTVHVDPPPSTTVTSTDGNDRILNFDLYDDHLALVNVADAQTFKSEFSVVKVPDGANHTLKISIDGDTSWSVTLKLSGVQPTDGWNDFEDNSDGFETWVWNNIVMSGYEGPGAEVA